MLQPPLHSNRWAASTLRCQDCQARCNSVWGQLEDASLSRLDQQKTVLRLEPGEVLYRQGEASGGLYVVHSGTLALRKFDDLGQSVLLRLVTDGEAVGYRSFFERGNYRAQAEALETTQVCYLKAPLLHETFGRNPALLLGMLQRLANQLAEAEERFLMATRRSVRCRLAHALLGLRDLHGEVDEAGVLTVTLPISRQDLADLLGTRPETIARTTKALERDGVAVFRGRKVLIADLDLLFDEVELGGPQ